VVYSSTEPTFAVEGPVRLSIRIDARSFVVFDAERTTIARALIVLGAQRFVWVVLQTEQAFFLFSRDELRKLFEKAKRSSLLVAALGLAKRRPSVVVSRRDAKVSMEVMPADDTPACRAVVASKNAAGEWRVLAVGTLRKATRTRAGGVRVTERPAVPQPAGREFVRRRLPAKKAVARKTPAKKAAKKSGRFVIIARKRFGFGFGESGGQPRPEKKDENAKDYETVDVFYATDREQKAATSADNGLVTFLNQLPDPVQLSYGVCSVTVPRKHKLGKIETPSIWTLKIQDRSRHFTISACAPRTKGEFFNQLRERIGNSQGQSCFVFIHGYNVCFEDAAMRTAQLTKDLKFPGVPILYSWASAHRLSSYSQDEETVSLTIKRLTPFLRTR